MRTTYQYDPRSGRFYISGIEPEYRQPATIEKARMMVAYKVGTTSGDKKRMWMREQLKIAPKIINKENGE